MARSLKTKGLEELEQLRRRVNRQHSLERISKADRDFLNEHLDIVEARIIRMDEADDKKVGSIW